MYKLISKNQLVRLCLLTTTVFAASTLAGCARPVQPHWTLKKQTIQQLRQNDIATLHAAGAKVIQQGETITIVIPSAKLFRADSANLLPSQRFILKTTAKLLRSYQTVAIRVHAYSDNVHLIGAPKARKRALTTRQAANVVDYLWRHGVNTRLLYAKGLGQKDPIAWNNTRMGRMLNARVEIQFRFYPRFKKYN